MRVGDRVRYIGTVKSGLTDKIGTIIHCDIGYQFGVQFDSWFGGHSCDNRGALCRCYYCRKDNLELLSNRFIKPTKPKARFI